MVGRGSTALPKFHFTQAVCGRREHYSIERAQGMGGGSSQLTCAGTALDFKSERPLVKSSLRTSESRSYLFIWPKIPIRAWVLVLLKNLYCALLKNLQSRAVPARNARPAHPWRKTGHRRSAPVTPTPIESNLRRSPAHAPHIRGVKRATDAARR
jgi:hypothetical protein